MKGLGSAESAQMTDYVATRWYRAPELLLAYKEYGYPGNELNCAVANIAFISRYVVSWLYSRRAAEKKSLPSWN